MYKGTYPGYIKDKVHSPAGDAELHNSMSFRTLMEETEVVTSHEHAKSSNILFMLRYNTAADPSPLSVDFNSARSLLNTTQNKENVVETPSSEAEELPVFAVTTRCPLGKACQSRKCRTDCDGMETCCRCQKWVVRNGKCTLEGWLRVSGPGDCKFTSNCPVGVVCTGVKILRTFRSNGYEELCCECSDFNQDGSCMANAFHPVRGSGDCRFEVNPTDEPEKKGAEAQGD